MVVDVAQASRIPAIAEPFFMELGAKVDLIPVMTADDLREGLTALPGMAAAGNGTASG